MAPNCTFYVANLTIATGQYNNQHKQKEQNMTVRKPLNPEMHALVWGTLGAIAAKHGISMSCMACRAGLDKTSFNKSKRKLITGYRMPTMASLCAVLDTFNITWEEWAAIWNETKRNLQHEKSRS